MTNNTVHEIVDIAGIGLAGKYAKEMAEGHPRVDTGRDGGLPMPTQTGDFKHDAAMAGGQLAVSYGLAKWIFLPIWKAWAICTAIGLSALGVHLGLGFALWLALQVFYLILVHRLVAGRKRKAKGYPHQPVVVDHPRTALPVAPRPAPQTLPASAQTHRR